MSTSTTSVEAFETVRKGHRVLFAPRDALGGGRGLRKMIRGRVSNVDTQAGTAQVGDWIVPLRKLRRFGADVYRDWSRAHRKAERKRVYGGLKRGQKHALDTCAKDARQASLAVCVGDYSGPMSKTVNAEAKRCREKHMREHGIEDTSDIGQCTALPVLLERALAAGKTPSLKGIEYLSADNGTVGIGDVITLGGHPFKLVSYSSDGQALLKDGFEIAVPSDRVPHDKGTEIRSGLDRLKAKRERRLKRMAERGESVILSKRKYRRRRRPASRTVTECFCHRRDRRGRFKHRPRTSRQWCFERDRIGRFKPIPHAANPRIELFHDLLGREMAELVGDIGEGEQMTLLEREHEFTPEEKQELRETERWRKKRDQEKSEGQLDFLENPLPGIPKWLLLIGGAFVAYHIWRTYR